MYHALALVSHPDSMVKLRRSYENLDRFVISTPVLEQDTVFCIVDNFYLASRCGAEIWRF